MGEKPMIVLSCAEAAEVVGRFDRESLPGNPLAMAALRCHGKESSHEEGCVFNDPNHWVVRLLAESQPH